MAMFWDKPSPEMQRAMDNIAQIEAEKQQKIYQLGQTFYDAHKNDAQMEEPYADLVDKITKLEENRKGFVRTKLQLEGKMMCENCDSIIPFGSVFCSVCGKKAGERAGAPAAEQQERKCFACGAVLEKDAKFCTSCGKPQS